MSILTRELLHSPIDDCTGRQVSPASDADRYGFAFIKSGFEPVQDELLADFNAHGVEVVEARPVILNPAVVDYIYRGSCKEFFYPAMYAHLTTKPVIAMALHSDAYNAQEVLNDLKCGTNGRPNLREKYTSEIDLLSDEDIEAWYRGVHPRQDEVTVQLTQQNVFHAADTPDEAVKSLHLIGIHNSEFWAGADTSDPRIRKLAEYILL